MLEIFSRIPMMGGRKIRDKKNIIEDEYTMYLMEFFEERSSIILDRLDANVVLLLKASPLHSIKHRNTFLCFANLRKNDGGRK
ncbi:MAG: hypothetical protein QXV23_02580 [Candidatus Bathyarchaeia archaeon]